MTKQQLPQTGGSFVRQPDGSLEQVEKPAAEPKPKSQKQAAATPKPAAKKETK
mgnify:CR=1 FL=1